MAINLVSLIMQFLTPDMIGRIASALGLDHNNTQTAIGAAIPGLLAGLSGVAAQPGGAQKLVDTARQQTGALGNFASMIGGANRSSLIEKGSQMLSSLLGGQEQTALAGAVGKYAGLGQNASASLLGTLAPVVMGTIGQQQGARSLDAGNITTLLSSQKDNIAAALPAGFASPTCAPRSPASPMPPPPRRRCQNCERSRPRSTRLTACSGSCHRSSGKCSPGFSGVSRCRRNRTSPPTNGSFFSRA